MHGAGVWHGAGGYTTEIGIGASSQCNGRTDDVNRTIRCFDQQFGVRRG